MIYMISSWNVMAFQQIFPWLTIAPAHGSPEIPFAGMHASLPPEGVRCGAAKSINRWELTLNHSVKDSWFFDPPPKKRTQITYLGTSTYLEWHLGWKHLGRYYNQTCENAGDSEHRAPGHPAAIHGPTMARSFRSSGSLWWANMAMENPTRGWLMMIACFDSFI